MFKPEFDIQKAISFEALTIFPVYAKKKQDEREFITLDEALEKEYAIITETGTDQMQTQNIIPTEEEIPNQEFNYDDIQQQVGEMSTGSAQVNKLFIENKSAFYLYLMAGEVIIGCKQNRVIAQDTIIKPHSEQVPLDVFCVEQGRWVNETHSFNSHKTATHSKLRRTAQEQYNQSAVWDEISRKSGIHKVSSSTNAFNEIYEDKNIQLEIGKYEERLLKSFLNLKQMVGVVAVVEGRIMCADIFSNSKLFHKLWPKLLKSYILDALESDKKKINANAKITKNQVETFFEELKNANVEKKHISGVGVNRRLKTNKMSAFETTLENDLVRYNLYEI